MAGIIGLYILLLTIRCKGHNSSRIGASENISFEFDKFIYAETRWFWYGNVFKVKVAKNQHGKEEIISKWPPGPYALPMPVDGCPEARRKGWQEGHIELTWQQQHRVFSRIDSSAAFYTPDQPKDVTHTELPNTQSLLIGPYSRYKIKLNFCFKLRRKHTLDVGKWSNGNYSIYGDSSGCPDGFTIEIIKVRLGKVSYFTFDGMLPEFRLDRNDTNTDYLELRICSRVDVNGTVEVSTLMTQEYPFIFLQTWKPSLNCPVIEGTSVTQESLYLRQNEASNLTHLLRFCYFQPNAWTQADYSMRTDDVTIPEGILEMKVKGISRQLSQRTIQEADNDTNGFVEVLTSDTSVSVSLTWTLLDMGRTLPVFGIFIPTVFWPVKDEDSDFQRCYYSDRKMDFLHFEAYVCSYDVVYMNGTVSNRTFNNLERYNNMIIMKRIIESRYITFISAPRDVHNFETVFLVLSTDYSYLTDDSERCNIDLGMTDYGIDDFQISASSSLPRFPSAYSRPSLPGWCADWNDKFPYLLVDLYDIMKVEGVTILNKGEVIETMLNTSFYETYIQTGARAFSIKYGESKDNFTTYRNQVFRLNALYPVEEPQTFVFSFPFYARYVKIRVLEPLANNISCLRFELHGCRKIGTKTLQCKSSRTLKRVPALLDFYKKPLNEFNNVTSNECNSLCINNTDCSIVKSINGGKCLHYESNHNEKWNLDTTDTQTAIWSSKFCSSDYIKSSYIAYSKDARSLWPYFVFTYLSVIINETTLSSIGFPFNYKAGESYKWIIYFGFAFIKLVFTNINLNIYKNNGERTYVQDHLLFDDEGLLFDLSKLTTNPFVIDNKFNGKTFVIETDLQILTLSFISFEQTDEVFQRGTGFSVAVVKMFYPTCFNFWNMVASTGSVFCRAKSTFLSSRAYHNIQFTDKAFEWDIELSAGFTMIYLIHFDITCSTDTSFRLLEKQYCNLKTPDSEIYMANRNLIKVHFTSANPRDEFRLLFKYSKYEIMPTSISSKAADVLAIRRSIEFLAGIAGDKELTNSFKNYRSYNKPGYANRPNVPRLQYKACSETLNKCYSTFSYYGSWNFAGGECWIRRQRLVTIGSKEELKVIKYMLRNFKLLAEFDVVGSEYKAEFYSAYIGLRRVQKAANRHSFFWENMNPATFQDWRRGEPSSGDCTRMRFYWEDEDTTWETHDCLSNSAFYFVCEEVISNATKEITDRIYTWLYYGNISVTTRGYTCQRWDSQYPHKHHFTDANLFSGYYVHNVANFCRDPSRSNFLWCYTTDPNVRWDSCYLNELKEEVSPVQYQGYLDTTIDGRKSSKRNINDNNYCRFSNYNFSLTCYLEDSSIEHLCSLSDTASDRCWHLRQPAYKGTMNVTISGHGCQRWNQFFSQEYWIADDDLEDAFNYCRDPDSKGFQWCYIAYPVWEICTIEKTLEGGISSAVDYFECKDGQLVAVYQRCNGVINCDDLSDEIDCVTRVHPLLQDIKLAENAEEILEAALEYLYRCTSQEVISFVAVCDGVLDCRDASDEMNCTHIDVGTCAEDEFKCDDGSCISISLYCNVNSDCIDGSDENCVHSCFPEEFTCDNGQCVRATHRCDGLHNCLDRTDENNCELCHGSAFYCDNGRCIPKQLVCDTYRDCEDGTDEISCTFEGMLSCLDWWKAGYRETGMYTIEVLQFSKNPEARQAIVFCNFDSSADAKIYTTFRYGGIMKGYEEDGKTFYFTSTIDNYPYDHPFIFYLDGRSNHCTQSIMQTCVPHIQDLVGVDPYYRYIYSYCSCIMVDLLISSTSPELSSVRYCNDNKSVEIADIDNVLLFNYKYINNTQRMLEWKNVSVNFDNIYLAIGNAICREDISNDVPVACVEGKHVYDWSFRCLYDVDYSGLVKGCRSWSHLQNCDYPQNECPLDTVKCPGSYCIPRKFVCDEMEQCPNGEDELGCGCEDGEREILLVYEKGSIRGPDITKLVKQLHTPRSTLRSLVYTTSELRMGIPYLHRILEIKDKEIKRSELTDRNYECEYKLLANEFLSSLNFTKKKKKAILFIQSSKESELVANLMFSNITGTPNITIYRAMEAPSLTFKEQVSRFVIDVAVKNWNILSSLASRYLPEICREAFLTSSPGLYKCSSSKMYIPIGMVCDQIKDCIYGDDEFLCPKTCPGRCICRGHTLLCKVDDLNETIISSFSKLTRSLTVSKNNEAEITLSSNVLYFPYLYLLNLSSCNIKDIEPVSFITLVNLRVLDLSKNMITTLFPLVFSGLHNLHTLVLDGNSELETLEPFTFQYLKSVRYLRIAGTSLKILASSTFAGLSLERLDLENNNLQYIEAFGLGNFEVKHISFEVGSISSFDKEIFTGVSSLEYLWTPAYKYCCVRPNYLPEENCFPQKDEFSSCEDLMRNSVLQTLLWIIGSCSLLGNILTFIYRLKVDIRSLKTGYGIFVTNLAVADFLMGIYLIIIAVADSIFRKRYIFMDDYWRNSAWCTLAGVLSTLSSEASMMFICLITLDRLLVIKYPFGQVRLSRKNAAVLALVSWVVCALLSLFPLIYSEYFQNLFYTRTGVCTALPLTKDRPPGWLYSVLIFIILNFTAFLLIVAGQWSIFTNVRNSRGSLTSDRKRDVTVARNLLLVVATDFLCWFPIGCVGLMALSGHAISGEVYAWTAVFILPINSTLNPFLYTLTAVLSKKDFSPRIDEQKKQPIRPDSWFEQCVSRRQKHILNLRRKWQEQQWKRKSSKTSSPNKVVTKKFMFLKSDTKSAVTI